MKRILGLLTVLALSCVGLHLHAQSTNSAPSTNIVVTVVTPPAPPTIHNIKVPAGIGSALRASLLPQIDPQYAGVTGKSATSISLHKNPDGSWSGTIVFQ
jgi:hypothetical protein